LSSPFFLDFHLSRPLGGGPRGGDNVALAHPREQAEL